MITPSFSPTATERVLPKLAFDFTTASLDPRVTFTRALNTATRINSSGVVESVNADVPRFDYTLNTGGACKGLLIEEARTNLVFHSSNVLSGNWNQNFYNGGAVNYYAVTNGATPTCGPGNSNYFVATATPGSIAARQISLSLSSGATYTMSAYVYVPTQAGITSWRMDSNYQGGDYTVGVSQTVFDTWVRVSNTTTLTGARTTADFVILKNGGQTPTQGFAFYMTNMQIEAGAFPTSYIPTTTTALTRNADVATMTGTNFSDWFNASEGTFAAWASIPAEANSRTIICAGDGTAGERMLLNVQSSRAGGEFRVVDGGAEQCDILPNYAYTAGQTIKLTGAYKVNSFAASMNGVATGTDSSGTIPTPTTLYFGLNGVSLYSNLYIQKVLYWPQRLTNNEVQAFSK